MEAIVPVTTFMSVLWVDGWNGYYLTMSTVSILSPIMFPNFFTWLFRNWDAKNETLSLYKQSFNRDLPDISSRWKTGNAALCWRERQSLVAKTPISVGENANRQSRWRHALKHSIYYLFKSNVVSDWLLGFFLLSTEYRHLDRQFISRQKCVYVYNIWARCNIKKAKLLVK